MRYRVTPCHGYMRVDVEGEYEFEVMVDMIKKVHAQRTEKSIKRVLVVLTAMKGTAPTMDVYRFGEMAAEMTSDARAAAVVNESQHDRFFDDVAFNRGANVGVFTDEEEALRWLMEK